MLLALFLALIGGAVLAPPSGDVAEAEIIWTTTPACVDETEFKRQLGGLVSRGPNAPIELSAAPVAQGGWRVSVGFRGIRRELENKDCSLLTAAAALVVAVRIDAVATVVALESPELQRPSLSVPADPDPAELDPAELDSAEPDSADPDLVESAWVPPPESTSPPQSSIPRPRFVAGVGGGGDFGSLPRGGGAVLADVGVRWPRASAGAGFVGVFGPASQTNAAGVRGLFRTLTGVARGCGVLSIRAWEVPLCGGLEIGAVQARPRGLTEPRNVDALWLAPTAGVRLQRWLRSVAPSFFVDLSLPLLRHQFETTDAGTLHSIPPLVVRAGVAIRFRGR